VSQRVLVLGCPWWPLLAAGIARDTPAVVLEGGRVSVGTPGALALGITIGLRRREAETRCPSLTILKPDPAREAREFEKVLGALDGFTPFIEILRPGTCLFATRACARYFGGEDALAAQVLAAITATVRQEGCFGLGIADGLFAAGVAARKSLRTGEPVIVEDGGSTAFLAPQPVSLLGRPDLCDLLRRLGLKTLGAFAGLPSADVLARFGYDGVEAHRQAAGADQHRFVPRESQSIMELSEELDPPTDRSDIAVFAGKGMADRLAGQLEAEGLACNKVVIEAATEDGQTFSRTWRLDGGFSPGSIAQRMRWQLEGWLSGDRPPGSALAKLTLVPEEVTAQPGVQLSFWGGQTEPGRRAARGIARLQGLLGPEAVVVPEYRGGRGPDERFRLVLADAVDLLDRSATPDFLTEAPWPGHVPTPSPALVFPDRQGVGMLDGGGKALEVAGDRLTASPATLVLGASRRLEVTGWAGPWPVDERWWDPKASRQLARMQIACANNAAYLVAFEKGRWWLEAAYD
jgi:protein ImuB